MGDEAAPPRETSGRMREVRAIRVNGERREAALGSTVADLIASLQRDPRTVAVELNGSIVPRDRYEHVSLQEGDRLEIVQFVQGG